MRKRNFIKSFLYYSAIIAIPILTVFLVFLAFVFQAKQREIREDAETAAQAVRDNYSLVLDSAATQYDILARNPRLSISLRGFILPLYTITWMGMIPFSPLTQEGLHGCPSFQT